MFSDHFVNRGESSTPPLNYRHQLHGLKRSSDPVTSTNLVPSSQTLLAKFDPITTSLHGIPGYSAKNCSILLKDFSLSESPRNRAKTKRPAHIHHNDAQIESRPSRLKKHTLRNNTKLKKSLYGCDLHITRLKFSPHEFSHRKVSSYS